jgi:LmbE family N-acetylglucosaminyl deacetylase
MPRNLYQRIYLAPHLDDAALSCGGRIFLERQAGLGVLVITVMAGDAPPETKDLPTPIIADLHTRWELETNSNPVSVRRDEDREALAILGADVMHWEWPECVYRKDPRTKAYMYPTEASLWGSVHPGDQDLVTQLTQRLASLPLSSDARLYVPLTVGNHVDHHVVRQAAEKWEPSLERLVFYEEYPYAEQPEALALVIENGGEWVEEIIPITQEALDAKAAAVASYHSQISTFYNDTEEIAVRLRAYAAVTGGGQCCAERYWRRRRR